MNTCPEYDFSLFEPRPQKELRVLQPRDNRRHKKTSPITYDRKKVFVIILLLAICLAILLNIFVRAEVSELTFKQNKLKKQIEQQKSIYTSLMVEYESIVSYNTLEDEARKLGMDKIERNQIFYVDIDE